MTKYGFHSDQRKTTEVYIVNPYLKASKLMYVQKEGKRFTKLNLPPLGIMTGEVF